MASIFVYQPLTGDGTIVARVVSVEGSRAAQVGVMIRETLSAGANRVYLFDYSSSLLLTERTSTGTGSSYQWVGSATLPYWIKLVRSGNVFGMYGSTNGVTGHRWARTRRSPWRQACTWGSR